MQNILVFTACFLLTCPLFAGIQEVEQWNVFEISLNGPLEGNPFKDTELEATFTLSGSSITVDGFYDGEGVYKIRFMPHKVGEWKYITKSNSAVLNGKKGTFSCVSPTKNNHGPVRVSNTFHFAYADGTPFFPVGTTIYALTQMDNNIINTSLETLKKSPFNKLRMLVFPKNWSYFINHEPPTYPYEGSKAEGWDFSRFNPEYFQRLDNTIQELHQLGIQVDLILFHPYDWGIWGFHETPTDVDKKYLKYLIARVSAYQNVWWSMANEYDLMRDHTTEIWEELAATVMECDRYNHLRSIHNAKTFYDHTKPWITHVSIQRHSPEKIIEWRKEYNKPIIVDECSYEGDLEYGWGDITGQEMVHRFWKGYVSGGYVTHGEVYMNKDTLMFWAEGGKLIGESPRRIAFLKQIMEEGPASGINPLPFEPSWNRKFKAGIANDYYLHYFGNSQPSSRMVTLPEAFKYTIEVIDTWNMTIKKLDGEFSGEVKVPLPKKQFIALRIRKIE